MATADIIADIEAGKTVTKTKKVGKGKAAAEITVTRTAPEVKVVDETVIESTKEDFSGRLPEDAGKRTIEVLPGMKLVCYSKKYVCLRFTGKGYSGQKATIGKVLYRDDLKHLIETLTAELDATATYEEANGAVPF